MDPHGPPSLLTRKDQQALEDLKQIRLLAESSGEPLGEAEDSLKGPKKHISISNSWGYPYLIGLLHKGVYMRYPYPNFRLCPILGPYLCPANPELPLRTLGFRGLGFRDLGFWV